MTEVKVFRPNDEILGIVTKGHSGYARIGEDIVCAAVSVLMQALLVGIQEISGKISECHLRFKERSGLFEVMWDAEIVPEIRLLTETVALSLKRISESYPKNVKFMEVQFLK